MYMYMYMYIHVCIYELVPQQVAEKIHSISSVP